MRIDYYLNGNPAAYKSETIKFKVKNPVQALEVKNGGTQTVVDRQGGNANQEVALAQFFNLKDYQNVDIWTSTGNITNAEQADLTRYGITALTRGGILTGYQPILLPSAVTLEKAYYNSNPSVDIKNNLPQFTSATVVANAAGSAVARWNNSGATTITQAITLEYRVKVHNKFNDGQDGKASDVEKIIKIVVNPNI